MTSKRSRWLFLGFGVLAACNPPKPPAPKPEPVAPVAKIEESTTCYQFISKEKDQYDCQLHIKGNDVTGDYVWAPEEGHGASGSFKGTIKDDTITADWTFEIEGSTQLEEVVFKRREDQLVALKGELVEKGDKLVLKDPAKAKEDPIMTKIDCSKISQ